MIHVKSHLQTKFLAGALAAIPLGVTTFIFWYLDSKLREVFGVRIPGLGIPLALGVVYMLGVFVTSLMGRWLLGRADRILERLPGMRDLYRSWKQVLVTPDVSSGIFARTVLVPDESGRLKLFGFSTGRPLEGNADMLCVFLPNSPNPASGRLVFVAMRDCLFLQVSTREALKFVISGGNYVPSSIGTSLAQQAAVPAPETAT